MSLLSSPATELFNAAAPTVIDPADHPPLRGRGLRWVLLDELKHHAELSVARMAGILADHSDLAADHDPGPAIWLAYGWLWNT